jgi:hypothetical protein
VETASTRKDRPKLRATLDRLQPGDTLMIYKPDRVARSMKELLVFVEDELHARDIVPEILTGVCAGIPALRLVLVVGPHLRHAAALEAYQPDEAGWRDGRRWTAAGGADGGDEVVVAEDRVDVEVKAWAGGPDVLDRLLHALLPGDPGVGMVDPTRCEDLFGYRRVAGVPHVEVACYRALGRFG